MRLVCSNCEVPYVTNFVDITEGYCTSLCKTCRRQEAIDRREIPVPRLFGQALDMGRWFGGLIPRYSEQGRHTVDRSRKG